MRNDRFDRLVKQVAGRRSRRAFLAGVAGIAASSVTGRISPPFTPAIGNAASVCIEDARDPICPGGLNHAAFADYLMRSLTPSPAGCLPGDASCNRDDVCCSGICTMHGRCACFDAGHLCPGDGYCCGGVCRDGRCA
jgi:hypothetical protein